MKTPDTFSTCPRAVKASVSFWLVGCGLNTVRVVSGFDWKDWVMYPTFAMLVGLWLSVAWFVLRGKKWARWVLLGLVSFGLLTFPSILLYLQDIPAYQLVMAFLMAASYVGAASLLLSDSAKRWFNKEPQNVA
jgi:hypothetical protein